MNEKDKLGQLFQARTSKERTDSALKYAGIAGLSVLALWGMRYSAIEIGGAVSEGLVILGAGALVAAFMSLFFGLRFPGLK